MAKKLSRRDVEILSVNANYFRLYTAQHAFTASSRELGKALFGLTQSISTPKGKLALSGGVKINMYDIEDELSKTHAAADEAERTGNSPSVYYEEADKITDGLREQQPDYAGVLSATSTVGYFLTHKNYPSYPKLSATFTWLDQTNPENIVAQEACTYYRAHREVIVRQALAEAGAAGVEIVGSDEIVYGEDVVITDRPNYF